MKEEVPLIIGIETIPEDNYFNKGINQPLGEKFKEIVVGMDITQSKLKPMLIAEGNILKSIKNLQMKSKALLKKKLS